MKVLMISHYPPQHCGIGSYAQQSVSRLRRDGHIVNVLTPPEGQGDYTEDLRGGWNLLKLRHYAPYYDRVILQYCPSFYFVGYDLPGSAWQNLKACVAFGLLPRLIDHLEVVCHEEIYYSADSIGPLGAWLHRWKWLSHRQIYFHTRREREEFVRNIRPPNPQGRCLIRRHGEDFFKYRDVSLREARRELGIQEDIQLFLCIGFIQPNKGFDRAIRAFLQTTQAQARLYVVGSVRVEWLVTQRYLAELQSLAAQSGGRVQVIQRFVSDEEFDTWLSAADYIVAPYREVWSSSVLARARLFGKRIIAARTGGLDEQVTADDYLFDSDDELLNLFHELTHSQLKVSCREGHLILKKGARSLELDSEDLRVLLKTFSEILDG